MLLEITIVNIVQIKQFYYAEAIKEANCILHLRTAESNLTRCGHYSGVACANWLLFFIFIICCIKIYMSTLYVMLRIQLYACKNLSCLSFCWEICFYVTDAFYCKLQFWFYLDFTLKNLPLLVRLNLLLVYKV